MVEFAPFEFIEGAADSRILLLCDHASNVLPPEYGDLGLPARQFERHIAYDIGAAAVTRLLQRSLNAPALMTRYSRLLIDPNRGADDPTLVMRISDGAMVPANARIGGEEIARRRAAYWQPYRDKINEVIDNMMKSGQVPVVVSVHSFTPFWRGQARPWQIGILWDKDPRFAVPVIEALRGQGWVVGDNEPYDGALKGDTLYDTATARGLAHVLVEFRQDLVADETGALEWAQHFEKALQIALQAPHLDVVRAYGSRAG